MNAKSAAPQRSMKCNSCGHLYPDGILNEPCNRMIPKTKFTPEKGIINYFVDCKGKVVLTNGQRFKDKFGYSKSMKRAMKKQGLNPQAFSDSLAAYREIRKKRRQAVRKIQKERHTLKKSQRRAKAPKSETSKS